MRFKYKSIICALLAMTLFVGTMGAAMAEPGAGGASPQKHKFYFQLDSRWDLPPGGCWITSYAMVIRNLGVKATPKTVYRANGDSVMCYHSLIRKHYSIKPVDLRPLSHSLFSAYGASRGATYIRNSRKSASNVVKAIKLALRHHPEGVMVRFQGKPHTMVAIGYKGGTIYFDDPGRSLGSKIPFEQTCVHRAGFRWTDVTFLQALAKK